MLGNGAMRYDQAADVCAVESSIFFKLQKKNTLKKYLAAIFQVPGRSSYIRIREN